MLRSKIRYQDFIDTSMEDCVILTARNKQSFIEILCSGKEDMGEIVLTLQEIIDSIIHAHEEGKEQPELPFNVKEVVVEPPKNLVVYHEDCMDGLLATWAFRDLQNVTFTPGDREKPPQVNEFTNLVIVDFSYPRSVIEDLHKQAKSLLVIDHHPQSVEELKDLDYCVVDTAHSAAYLAFNHGGSLFNIPALVECMEKYDLWDFPSEEHLPMAVGIQSYIEGLKPCEATFQLLDALNKDVASAPDVLVLDGEAILRAQRAHLKKIADATAVLTVSQGYVVPVANSSSYQTELGNYLLEAYPGSPFSVVWSRLKDGKIRVSLRSDKQRDFNAKSLAQLYGGGGHRHAAGFTLDSIEELKVLFKC